MSSGRVTTLLAGLLALFLAFGAQAQHPSLRSAGVEPWLGLNLAANRDFDTQLAFINVMKSARDWTGHRRGQWGDWTEADLRAVGALTPEGWPLFVPDMLDGIAALALVDMPQDVPGLAGRWRVTWSGTGRIDLRGRVRAPRATAPNEIWTNFTPGPGFLEILIRESDPSDPVRDIALVHERHIAAHDAGEVFNPDFLARLDGARLLRFMPWGNINHEPPATWEARPQVDDYTWTPRGVPLEVMIDLANRLQADPWFSLPHMADDAYFEAAAQLIHDRLDPGLRAWIELSNETWNWGFSQAQDILALAEDRWGDRNLWQQWYAMRAAQMVQIFDKVFADAPGRLNRVLAVHTAWLGLEQELLAPRWQAENPANPAPPTLFDSYAVAAYLGALSGHPDEKAPMVRDWLAQARAQALTQGRAQGLGGPRLDAFATERAHDEVAQRLVEDMRDGRHSGDASDSLDHFLETLLPYHAGIAQRWGLDLVAYEGGTHLVGVGEVMNDDALTALFIHTNYSEPMGALYADLLEGWFRAGAGQFTHYSDIRRPTRWGSFGLLRHLGDDNPRWRSVTSFDPAQVTP